MALSALALVCLASAAQAEIATYYGWDVEPRQVKGSILQAYRRAPVASLRKPEFEAVTPNERPCVSLLLIAAYSRPFTGEISVGPDLLKQVITSESAAAQR